MENGSKILASRPDEPGSPDRRGLVHDLGILAKRTEVNDTLAQESVEIRHHVVQEPAERALRRKENLLVKISLEFLADRCHELIGSLLQRSPNIRRYLLSLTSQK